MPAPIPDANVELLQQSVLAHPFRAYCNILQHVTNSRVQNEKSLKTHANFAMRLICQVILGLQSQDSVLNLPVVFNDHCGHMHGI